MERYFIALSDSVWQWLSKSSDRVLSWSYLDWPRTEFRCWIYHSSLCGTGAAQMFCYCILCGGSASWRYHVRDWWSLRVVDVGGLFELHLSGSGRQRWEDICTILLCMIDQMASCSSSQPPPPFFARLRVLVGGVYIIPDYIIPTLLPLTRIVGLISQAVILLSPSSSSPAPSLRFLEILSEDASQLACQGRDLLWLTRPRTLQLGLAWVLPRLWVGPPPTSWHNAHLCHVASWVTML